MARFLAGYVCMVQRKCGSGLGTMIHDGSYTWDLAAKHPGSFLNLIYSGRPCQVCSVFYHSTGHLCFWRFQQDRTCSCIGATRTWQWSDRQWSHCENLKRNSQQLSKSKQNHLNQLCANFIPWDRWHELTNHKNVTIFTLILALFTAKDVSKCNKILKKPN